MRSLLYLIVVAATALVVAQPAQAFRLSGASLDSQSSVQQSQRLSSRSSMPGTTVPRAASRQTFVKTPMISPWGNMLGGLLLGLGLGGMLSAVGDHSALTHSTHLLLLLGLAIFGAYRVRQWWLGDKLRQYEWSTYVPEIDARIESAGLQLPLTMLEPEDTESAPGLVPYERIPGFDVSVFVNNAKTRFVCLQRAWDKGDFSDIRRYTTPAMLSALRQQSLQPGRIMRNADVVQLYGTLKGVRPMHKEYVASIHFEGLMKPMPEASAEPFSEIWHISKPMQGNHGWALAGIQKIS